VRNRFADTFYELGKVDPRLCVVVADISPAGSIAKFRNEFPRRFINTGVSEQIMIGMTAGMAQRGLKPFAYTIATFTLYRPFEMVRDDLCYQNLPVTIVGIGGGVTYSTLGATHHAQEDVAIASAIPNLSVIAPCDPSETEAATRWCAAQEQGPVYLRLGKAGEPDLSKGAPDTWAFGKLRRLRAGRDICILSYGPIMKRAFAVAERFEAAGKRGDRFGAHAQAARTQDAIGNFANFRPCRRHRGMCAERQSRHACEGIGLGCRRCLPDRHLHAQGLLHPLLRQPRRHSQRPWAWRAGDGRAPRAPMNARASVQAEIHVEKSGMA
jgi:transketolase